VRILWYQVCHQKAVGRAKRHCDASMILKYFELSWRRFPIQLQRLPYVEQVRIARDCVARAGQKPISLQVQPRGQLFHPGLCWQTF
jgi:hypothetical protein